MTAILDPIDSVVVARQVQDASEEFIRTAQLLGIGAMHIQAHYSRLLKDGQALLDHPTDSRLRDAVSVGLGEVRKAELRYATAELSCEAARRELVRTLSRMAGVCAVCGLNASDGMCNECADVVWPE